MKVIDHLRKADRTLFSFEILPPLKGRDIHSIYEGIDPLLEFKPSFINVTYHREEVIYKERGHGLLQKIRLRKRPGTVGICAMIKAKYNIDTVPHLICGGFSQEDTEDALIELNFLGIDNVLALRGDAIKNEPHFIPERDGHPHAVDLIRQINQLNQGKNLYDEEQEAAPTQLCIGAACYPEKHPEALNLNVDVAYLKEKVAAGAEYGSCLPADSGLSPVSGVVFEHAANRLRAIFERHSGRDDALAFPGTAVIRECKVEIFLILVEDHRKIAVSAGEKAVP